METFGKICYSMLLAISAIFVGGFALLLLWKWFIVTIFHLQPLTIAQAIGLMVFTAFFKGYKKGEDTQTIHKLTLSFFETLGKISFILLTGWIVTLFL